MGGVYEVRGGGDGTDAVPWAAETRTRGRAVPYRERMSSHGHASPAETVTPRAAEVMTADGVSLRVFDDRGEDDGGDGVPLILLHGLGGRAREMRTVARCLRTEVRAIAMDQRGHGDSTRNPRDLSRTAHVTDVIAVADALGLARFALLGQSMGAHTAMLTAAAHPERVASLVLIEGGVGGEGAQASQAVVDWFRAWPVPFASHAEAVEHFGRGAAGDAWAKNLERTEAGLVPAFDFDVLYRAILAVHETARWEEWRAVRAPTLLITAENGYVPRAERVRMLAENPRVTAAEVPGAGHDAHLDSPRAVAELVLAHLRSKKAPPR